VRVLAELGADVHAQTAGEGTALQSAAKQGQVEAVNVLVELGADVHSQDVSGYTVLHWAAAKGQAEAVRVLVELGADLHSIDNRGRSALRLASERGHRTVVRFLAERVADLAAKSTSLPAEHSAPSASSAAVEGEQLPPAEAPPRRHRPPRACAQCGASQTAEGVRLQWCRCLGVRYCNSACQKRHWKAEHRDHCSSRRVQR